MSKRKTKEEFISEAKLIHGDKYDYSLVDYKGNKSKIYIGCKYHGNFLQVPSSHLIGNGCKKCAMEKLAISKRISRDEFILKSQDIHKNKFNYDKVIYTNVFADVIIICKIHGEYTQIPHNHLRGHGCPKCSNNKRLSVEDFMNKANEIHYNKYIYGKIDSIVNNKQEINIMCRKHGEYKQNICNHLNGQGCPKCNSSKGELQIESILKENNIKYKPQYSFSDLKYKRGLLFDFGVLDENGNLLYLIEYNGKQHYEFIDYLHKTEEKFEIQKVRDKLKENYCKVNNIPLIIIKYNENINEKLIKFL